MKKIKRVGGLPKPINTLLGISNEEIQNALWNVHGYPEIWECSNIEEFGEYAHYDECEIQPLIDNATNRYFITAMTIDPDRVRQKIDEIISYDQVKGKEVGIPAVVPDEAPKPMTIVYYVEITEGEYKVWAKADADRRIKLINERNRKKSTRIL